MDTPSSPADEALAYWYGLVNYEQRPASPDDFKLDRMRGMLHRLGDPHTRLRVVHVAGSKGKGSTSAMLAAVLRRSGYHTGLFTSPHLTRVEERFRVDDEPITPRELTALLLEVREAAGREVPTFFEVATAVGFLHFVRRRCDVVVLEVGLGGRLDSTNVCRPAVALLTSISYDHTKQLGPTLAHIAAEKAGIVKPRRPAVSGVTAPEARSVIEETCRVRGAPLRQIGRDFTYFYEAGHVTATRLSLPRVEVMTWKRTWPWLELNLLGVHQATNAATAVAAIEELRSQGWHLPDRAVAGGLAEVTWPARLELVGRRPFVVLDCAHNVASAQAVVDTLTASFPASRRLLVFAGSSDKDLAGMFRVLAPHFHHAFLTRYTQSQRAVTPEELAKLWPADAAPFSLFSDPLSAWKAARAESGPDDLICVTGSVFLAGELRPHLLNDS